MESDLDGNAAAGILQAIFPFDMTLAEATCIGCGRHSVLATTAVYRHGMGTIVRCRTCDTVLIRVAEISGRFWLDMRGMRDLELSDAARDIANRSS
jgi:hypothetical protein